MAETVNKTRQKRTSKQKMGLKESSTTKRKAEDCDEIITEKKPRGDGQQLIHIRIEHW